MAFYIADLALPYAHLLVTWDELCTKGKLSNEPLVRFSRLVEEALVVPGCSVGGNRQGCMSVIMLHAARLPRPVFTGVL